MDKSRSNLVIYPSKINTVPFTVPRMLNRVCRLQPGNGQSLDISAAVDFSESRRSSVRWSSEPYLLSSAVSKITLTESIESTEDEANRSCSSLLYYGIDPSLYLENDRVDFERDFDDQNIGRVWFGVEYDPESEKLVVSLIQLRNLPSRIVGTNNGCDPFVRVCLLPDERRYLQSQFKRKTCNPRFDENFTFQISNRDLKDRSIKLTAFDIDRHKRHVVVGHVIYPLNSHVYEPNEKVVVWRDLEKEAAPKTALSMQERSQIYLSLCYNTELNRLNVGIYTGKNFSISEQESHTSPDFYVKVRLVMQMNRVVKTKKTETAKRSTQPIFNEMFKFKLPTNPDLNNFSISVTVMHYISGHKDFILVFGTVSFLLKNDSGSPKKSINSYSLMPLPMPPWDLQLFQSHLPAIKRVVPYKTFGRVILGSFMFARGPGLEHWNEMIAKPKEQISRWHMLAF